MKYLHTLFFITLMATVLIAQEFDATVKVNVPKLQQTDAEIFQSMEQAVVEFFNNQAFTDEEYEDHERIKVSFQFTIQGEQGNGNFTSTVAIQATRPVYNSDYETVLMTHVDPDLSFNYNIGTILQHNENGFTNNLSSILSFWAYIILGMDHDSFMSSGGDKYYSLALNTLNNVPSGTQESVGGWQAKDGDRNRYWMLENLQNPRMKDFRIGYYRYHRLGLDMMFNDPASGRQAISDAVQIAKSAQRDYPNNMIVQIFAQAKAQEIVDVMAAGTRAQQRLVNSAMTTIDPSNRDIYNQLQ